ncbi:hypothetical protein KC727_02605 [Candidatus Kaiserbacteria bacterium]|nr:hypothetical protein [Candidatus Kaiserbacteria bacterium]
MSEAEKQDSQKTVVAFVVGLLVGGLLVWVFSSPSETSPTDDATETPDAMATEKMSDTSDHTAAMDDTVSMLDTITVAPARTSAALSVADQPAGFVVVLSDTTYPAPTGWIAVREYMDGIPGNVLGAARFNEEEGLTPTSVSLLRATESGSSYQVVYYSENGDRVFDLADDALVEEVSATFVAE